MWINLHIKIGVTINHVLFEPPNNQCNKICKTDVLSEIKSEQIFTFVYSKYSLSTIVHLNIQILESQKIKKPKKYRILSWISTHPSAE